MYGNILNMENYFKMKARKRFEQRIRSKEPALSKKVSSKIPKHKRKFTKMQIYDERQDQNFRTNGAEKINET